MRLNFLQVPVQPGLLPDSGDFTDPAEGSDQPAAHGLHPLQVHDRPDSRILLVPPPADSIPVIFQTVCTAALKESSAFLFSFQ